ncbi:hypothetical protein G4X40_14225 [Rhodococcus sp. D2-41]|uniref:Uncharacterized protein n=1 Tax=Speluncibacter jeojiensis TaxID=2710754 RepID=A0A9X4M0P8_9ACTN|nr:hypothetical protein [Rhodococcus sp. D2-41]MDG3011308.1 hypothetical protein [Rhodococcus sp. D2-41]MDG3015840.1 hypothetical protein [Corynebacteriales bacterium D3-21]
MSDDKWTGTVDWLVRELPGQPVGIIVDLGPKEFIAPVCGEDCVSRDAGEHVFCAQVHLLEDGVFLVRRSRRMLHRLRLSSHRSAGLVLDTWVHDGHFEDCTDGYLFTRDHTLAAQIVVAWFRDNSDAPPHSEMGCAYELADVLPAEAYEDDPTSGD